MDILCCQKGYRVFVSHPPYPSLASLSQARLMEKKKSGMGRVGLGMGGRGGREKYLQSNQFAFHHCERLSPLGDESCVTI